MSLRALLGGLRSRSRRRTINRFLLALVLLTLGTWMLGSSGWQYRGGGDFAFRGQFPVLPEQWSTSGAGSVDFSERAITLVPDPDPELITRTRFRTDVPRPRNRPGGILGRLHRVVFGERLLQVRYFVRTLEPPQAPLQGRARPARLAAWLIDENRSRKPFRFATIANLSGAERVLSGATVIALPARVDALDLVFMSLESTGQFRLEHLDARAVYETLPYRALWLLGVVGWLAWTTLAGVAVLRVGGWRVALLLSGAVSAIVIGVLLPETVRLEPLRALIARLIGVPVDHIDDSITQLYKIGHFLFFAIATLVLLSLRQRLGMTRFQVIAFFTLFALATESFQLHLYDRTSRGADVLIDLAGVALAALIVIALRLDQRQAMAGDSSSRRRRRRTRDPATHSNDGTEPTPDHQTSRDLPSR